MPTSADAIVALMIGESPDEYPLNKITCDIVMRAVELWHSGYAETIVCESSPMQLLAIRLGVPTSRMMTAIQNERYTTRRVAENIQPIAKERGWTRFALVTQAVHAARARKTFSNLGLEVVQVHTVSSQFDSTDPDWKLRSCARFRIYNALASVYCRLRGWT